MLKPSYSASDRDSARLVIALHKKAPGAPTALGVFLPPHEVSMSKAMSALTIASLLWSCTTLPASAAWRICGSLYNAYCVVEEKSPRPCALALTERGGQTWPYKRKACVAIWSCIRSARKAQCLNRPVPGGSSRGTGRVVITGPCRRLSRARNGGD